MKFIITLSMLSACLARAVVPASSPSDEEVSMGDRLLAKRGPCAYICAPCGPKAPYTQAVITAANYIESLGYDEQCGITSKDKGQKVMHKSGGGLKVYAYGAPATIPCPEMADYIRVLIDECSCSGDDSLGDRTDGKILYAGEKSYVAFHAR